MAILNLFDSLLGNMPVSSTELPPIPDELFSEEKADSVTALKFSISDVIRRPVPFKPGYQSASLFSGIDRSTPLYFSPWHVGIPFHLLFRLRSGVDPLPVKLVCAYTSHTPVTKGTIPRLADVQTKDKHHKLLGNVRLTKNLISAWAGKPDDRSFFLDMWAKRGMLDNKTTHVLVSGCLTTKKKLLSDFVTRMRPIVLSVIGYDSKLTMWSLFENVAVLLSSQPSLERTKALGVIFDLCEFVGHDIHTLTTKPDSNKGNSVVFSATSVPIPKEFMADHLAREFGFVAPMPFLTTDTHMGHVRIAAGLDREYLSVLYRRMRYHVYPSYGLLAVINDPLRIKSASAMRWCVLNSSFSNQT